MLVQDVMHKLSVPLEELYVGSTKKLALNRHIADGQGRVTKKKEVLEVCPPLHTVRLCTLVPNAQKASLRQPRCRLDCKDEEVPGPPPGRRGSERARSP